MATLGRLALVLAATALAALWAGAASVHAQEPEHVTFRLTLRGDVNPSDGFSLAVNPDNGLIVDVGYLCAPTGTRPEPVEPCAARDYEVTIGGEGLPPGTDLRYVFARDPQMQCTNQPSGCAQRLCEGTVTIMEHHQLVHCVYDYSLGSTPAPAPTVAASPAVGALPNTAMPHGAGNPAGVVVESVLLIGLLTGLGIASAVLRPRRSAVRQ